jgi:hypothetical protein
VERIGLRLGEDLQDNPHGKPDQVYSNGNKKQVQPDRRFPWQRLWYGNRSEIDNPGLVEGFRGYLKDIIEDVAKTPLYSCQKDYLRALE